MSDDRESLIGVREAARILQVHENTVRNWVKRGLLEAVELPGSGYLRFRRDAVEGLAGERGGVADASRYVVPHVGLVGADVLSGLPNRRAQELLPHLVRRLLQASPGVRGLSLRAGEGIAAEGWDAVVLEAEGSPWVPKGESRWELGTGKDPRSKAQSDFAKRTENPLGAGPAQATFVFVSCRRSPALKKWADERRAEGKWRDVQALDADDLEAWLEACPSAQLWLAEKVGVKLQDVITLAAWWRRLSTRTRPPIPGALLLAGRDEQADRLRGLLSGDLGPLAVRARSRMEALAFVAATLEDVGGDVGARVVVASSLDGWDRLARSHERSILIPEAEGARVTEAIENGHTVVVPLGPTDSPGGLTVLELPGLDRHGAREALQALDISFDRADALAATACRSFEALMRDAQLAWEPVNAPPWAGGETSFALAPLVLVGSWTAAEADQAIVSEIAGREKAEIFRLLRTWSGMQDPPIVEAGGVWRIASPEAALGVLGMRLGRDAVQRFCDTALKVLSESDPVLELPVDQRIEAGLKGIRARYSAELRRGVSEGLALLAARGQELVLEDQSTASEYATRCVRELLERANRDAEGVLWQSLSGELPRIAEAAPEHFLDAVNTNLAGERPTLANVFHDHGDYQPGLAASPHTGLLWALEVIAWSPEPGHLAEAALALARLDELDEPRGKLGNRPDASLRTIFLPWFPQTAASLDRRLAVLDQLRKKHPDVAWRLEISLLPHSHDTSMRTQQPRFREWVPEQQGAPLPEYLRAVTELAKRVIQDAGNEPSRFLALVPLLPGLPPGDREAVVTALEASVPQFDKDVETTELWLDLIKLVQRHRHHSDADWALDDSALARLNDVATSLRPSDLVTRSAPLFDWRPPMLNLDQLHHDEWEKTLFAAEDEAMVEVLKGGIDALRRLAAEANMGHLVAASAARVAGDDLRDAILPLLATEGSDGELAASWVAAMAGLHGPDWVRCLRDVIVSWPKERQRDFLLALRPGSQVWELLDELDDEVGDAYWKGMRPLAIEPDDVEHVTERLLDQGRAWAAITVLARRVHQARAEPPRVPDKLILKALEAGVRASPTEERSGDLTMASYEVGLLLDHIAAAGVDIETVAQYEWQYFPLLEDMREQKALYATLGNDPDLFIDLVCLVFKAHGEPKRDIDEGAAILAQQAWRVLHHWSRLPGTRDDGAIDTDRLRKWVRKARFELAERDREAVGDQQVGAVLATSPVGEDGVWPAEPVRDILEDITSKHVETGLRIGRYNARGVTSRGAFEGGAQERNLSKQYADWAGVIGDRWPRTARVLRQLAESYEKEARQMDAEARRRETE